MRHLHHRIVLLGGTALVTGAALAIASCTHGNYDGSGYDGGIDTGITTDTGAEKVVLSRAVDITKDDVFSTPGGVFELTIPKGAYDAPVTITIVALADGFADSLIVPVFAVRVDKEPARPVQVVFRGNGNSGGDPNRPLFVAEASGGKFVPLPMASLPTNTGTGGTNGTYWGITKKLAQSFSLVYESTSGTTFIDVTPTSCLAKCCKSSVSGGSFNAAATSTGCACAGTADLGCFIDRCAGFDLATAAARCQEIGTNNPPISLKCVPFAYIDTAMPGPCPGPSCPGYQQGECNTIVGGSNTTPAVCCITSNDAGQHSGQCAGNNGGSSTVCGNAIRCDQHTLCPKGRCCVFENEAYCAETCPNDRWLCNDDTQCDAGVDSGACQTATFCPFKTCGTPPHDCQ